MRRLFFAFLLVTAPAFADSITIGTLTYLGTNSQGYSTYQVVLNTTGITAEPHLVDIGIGANQIGATYGPFNSVDTITFGPGGGVPNCGPCPSISVIAWFPNDKTFLLANAESFTPWKSTSPLIVPLPGHSTILAGQSAPIIITSVPEPGTAFLIGIGLASLIARRRFSSSPPGIVPKKKK